MQTDEDYWVKLTGHWPESGYYWYRDFDGAIPEIALFRKGRILIAFNYDEPEWMDAVFMLRRFPEAMISLEEIKPPKCERL